MGTTGGSITRANAQRLSSVNHILEVKKKTDVVKIMGGYSEDEDQDRRYQVFATDGNMKLWTRLDELSQHDLSNLNAYCQMVGVKADGSRDLGAKRLLDPVNLIDYMLVIFYGGNLDAP